MSLNRRKRKSGIGHDAIEQNSGIEILLRNLTCKLQNRLEYPGFDDASKEVMRFKKSQDDLLGKKSSNQLPKSDMQKPITSDVFQFYS